MMILVDGFECILLEGIKGIGQGIGREIRWRNGEVGLVKVGHVCWY